MTARDGDDRIPARPGESGPRRPGRPEGLAPRRLREAARISTTAGAWARPGAGRPGRRVRRGQAADRRQGPV